MDGLTEWHETLDGKYYGILTYSRRLTEDEVKDYELDELEVNDGTMERLTSRNEKGSTYIEDGINMLGAAVDKLADFEDAEENGTLVKLPCKVGDTVYRIDTDILLNNKEVVPLVIDNIVICDDGDILLKADAYDSIICTADNIINGTPYLDYYRVFFSREEAEKALKERESE